MLLQTKCISERQVSWSSSINQNTTKRHLINHFTKLIIMLIPYNTFSRASFFLTSSSSSSSSSSSKKRMVLILFVAWLSQVSSSTALSTRLSRAPQRARLSKPKQHMHWLFFVLFLHTWVKNILSSIIGLGKKKYCIYSSFHQITLRSLYSKLNRAVRSLFEIQP